MKSHTAESQGRPGMMMWRLLGHVLLVVIDKLTSVSFIQHDDSEIKGDII